MHMITIEGEALTALVKAIRAAHLELEKAEGRAVSEARSKLRMLEDVLGAQPSGAFAVVQAPQESSEFDSALVNWVLQTLTPSGRDLLYAGRVK